ncbi:MAG: DpnII family type II restriction endonuclease [Peptostreptococcaceae bacterium]|nr:DpnII family type II restriction endonuclease [Peptostreptococcaceae bacterium]
MYGNRTEQDLVNIFVDNILTTNREYSFFVNWENAKSYEEFSIELHAMSSLIRNENFKETFFNLLKKLPSVVNTFPLLFALSKMEREELWKGRKIFEVIDSEKEVERFTFSRVSDDKSFSNEEIERYYNFFDKMGLKFLFLNLLEQNVVDYVVGALVGLDSNGRKNRSGTFFESICKEIIEDICVKYGIEMIEQKQFKKLSDYGIAIEDKDILNRKADFILIRDNKALNIETNYYYAAGSKPEEIIDSYINRAHELKRNGIEFVLLTDGSCWDNKNKNQLNKAFRHIVIMNYYMAKNGYLEEKIKEAFEI